MSSTGSISWATEASQQRRTVKTIKTLSGNLAYETKGQLFDIAILEVSSPFTLNTKVVVAKLPTGKTAVGTNLLVSGWGTTTEGIKYKLYMFAVFFLCNVKIQTFSFGLLIFLEPKKMCLIENDFRSEQFLINKLVLTTTI
jgi:hypothetical protein